MTFYKLIISLSFISSIAQAQEVCNYQKVTNNCEFFKNLKPDSVIQLANGELVPACSLSSVFSQTHQDAMLRSEEAQVELRDFIMAVPDSVFSQSFKQSLIDSGLNNLGSMTQPTLASARLVWPPNSTSTQTQKVVARDFVSYFSSQSSVDATQLLRLMAEADNYQHSNVRESLQRNTTPQYTHQTEVNAYKRVQKETLDFLSSLGTSPAIQSAMSRVQSYNINPSFSLPSSCESGRPGAANSFGTGTVSTGMGMAYLPESARYRALAHELAHSFDPCRSDSTAIRPTEQMRSLLQNNQIIGNGDTNFVLNYFEEGTDMLGSPTLAAPFALTENPFYGTYLCLMNQARGNASGNPLNRGLGRFNGNYTESEPIASAEAACGLSQGNEIFCDWFAAQILERLIQKSGTSNGGSSPQNHNPNVVQAPPGFEYLLYTLDGACTEEIEGEELPSRYAHPSRRRRVNLMLNNPTVAQAFGCQRTPNNQVICPANETISRSIPVESVEPENTEH